jgi:hypothetical protein
MTLVPQGPASSKHEIQRIKMPFRFLDGDGPCTKKIAHHHIIKGYQDQKKR